MIINYALIAGSTKEERVVTYISWSLLVVALVASILSAFGICSGGCTDAENYTLFGLRFSSVGIPFIVMAMFANLFRNCRTPGLHHAFDFMISGAAGSEFLFIYIQKHLIGHYCPVCMVIAMAVFAASALRVLEVVVYRRATSCLNRFTRGVAYCVAMILIGFCGLTLSIAGTSNNFSGSASSKLDQAVWFGNKNSSIEVFFVTDWFCSYCKVAEPIIERMLPTVGQSARFTFLDDPIHKESLNFMPFHASLLLNDKPHYNEGRKVLLELAEKTKTPSELMVKDAFARHGLTFRMSDYATAAGLSNSAVAFARANGVTMTPSIVIRNTITGERKVLAGIDVIRENTVLEAIKKLQR